MNFFQSVFSDDPDPKSEPEPEPEPESTPPNPNLQSITSAWTFGTSLIQTLASKSDSVIQTYRRDLQDFTSGIKSETAVIRQAAVNAVNNLPTSFEAGAGLAQESLESVGQAIDDLAGIIAQGKDSILAGDYSDSNSNSDGQSNRILRNSKPYSRVDEMIRTVKCDMNTYLIDPEDLDEFNEWRSRFRVDENVGEIEDVMNESDGTVSEIFNEIVPERVDEELFWSRYFYKVCKIRKVEEARVKLVNRVISGEEDEEELSWDVDEDEYEEDVVVDDLKVDEKESGTEVFLEKKDDERKDVSESKNENENESEVDNVEVKSDVKTASEGKTDKDSDISIVSSQPSPEEDGWDEIEDIGSGDESKEKVVSHGSPGRVELRKRLSVAEEEEEDLTWDIEDDDDETAKA